MKAMTDLHQSMIPTAHLMLYPANDLLLTATVIKLLHCKCTSEVRVSIVPWSYCFIDWFEFHHCCRVSSYELRAMRLVAAVGLQG